MSDPDKKVAQAYGVLPPRGSHAQRWTFIIDSKGILRHIDRAVNPGTHGRDVARRLEELGIPKE